MFQLSAFNHSQSNGQSQADENGRLSLGAPFAVGLGMTFVAASFPRGFLLGQPGGGCCRSRSSRLGRRPIRHLHPVPAGHGVGGPCTGGPCRGGAGPTTRGAARRRSCAGACPGPPLVRLSAHAQRRDDGRVGVRAR